MRIHGKQVGLPRIGQRVVLRRDDCYDPCNPPRYIEGVVVEVHDDFVFILAADGERTGSPWPSDKWFVQASPTPNS